MGEMRLPCFFAFAAAALAQPADVVLRNGKIVTEWTAMPVAQAMAVRGGKVAAVGSDREAQRWIGPQTRVIDLSGQLAIPGFIEGHGHFTGIGEYRQGLDLREARTWDDIVAQVARAVRQAKPGEWIVGRGWHQSKWTQAPDPNVEGFPLHESLDQVSPANPVLLTHASGHAVFVNAKAMEAAGLTRDTPNPKGGEILKDARGNPTGLLRETAQGLANRAYGEWRSRRTPAQQAADLRKAIDLATDDCLSKGITSFEDAGSPFATVDAVSPHGRRPRTSAASVGHAASLQPGTGAESGPLSNQRRGGQPSHGSRDQALHGWRSGLARRLAAGAVRR